jgi:ribosomal protein L37AE/L43A
MPQSKPIEVNLNCSVCGSAGINRIYEGIVYCETHYQVAKDPARKKAQKETAAKAETRKTGAKPALR